MGKLKPNQFEYWPGTVITERPILFQTDMVRAILEGRKTQTRREIKGQPTGDESINLKDLYNHNPEYFYEICKYGKPGDLIWVRETWAGWEDLTIHKAQTFDTSMWFTTEGRKIPYSDMKWKPSIHMPKVASRIWLMVEEVRVERLNDIIQKDAIAEGIFPHLCPINGVDVLGYKNYFHGMLPTSPRLSFFSLWESINGKESLDKNSWVWVVQFRVLSTAGKPSEHVIKEYYTDIMSLYQEVASE